MLSRKGIHTYVCTPILDSRKGTHTYPTYASLGTIISSVIKDIVRARYERTINLDAIIPLVRNSKEIVPMLDLVVFSTTDGYFSSACLKFIIITTRVLPHNILLNQALAQLPYYCVPTVSVDIKHIVRTHYERAQSRATPH